MKNLLKALPLICICCIQVTVFAQYDTENFNSVEIATTNFKKEPVNMFVLPDDGLQLKYENPSGLPNYFQFSSNSPVHTSLTVQITVTDKVHVQTITREVDILDQAAFYEVPIHPYLTSALAGNPDAVIQSISFVNKSNSKIMIRETVFSPSSINYPIGINQVFVLDKASINKRYYIHANFDRPVQINIYDSKGVLVKRVKSTLTAGDNFLGLELLEELRPDKYVILVSDALNTNIASTMTVMF